VLDAEATGGHVADDRGDEDGDQGAVLDPTARATNSRPKMAPAIGVPKTEPKPPATRLDSTTRRQAAASCAHSARCDMVGAVAQRSRPARITTLRIRLAVWHGVIDAQETCCGRSRQAELRRCKRSRCSHAKSLLWLNLRRVEESSTRTSAASRAELTGRPS
jgi:hypothetical protein